MRKVFILIIASIVFIGCIPENKKEFEEDIYLKCLPFSSFSFIKDTIVIASGEFPDYLSLKGAYLKGLVEIDTIIIRNIEEVESDSTEYSKHNYGISYPLFEVLKHPNFQKTFIATKEFKIRMDVIQSNDKYSDEILLKYLNNLDMNLYEVDSLVYDFLSSDKFNEIEYLNQNAAIFSRLSRLKNTNVKDRQEVNQDFLKSINDKARIRDY